MFKKLIIIAIVIVGAVAVYYSHFYFVTDQFDEMLPENMVSAQNLSFGSFVEVDFIHKGSGEARIIKDVMGHSLVRLQNFKVTNGPDLYVYLSKSDNPKENIGEFVDLGRLKGNQGSQNYEIPQGVDLSEYKSIIIWCKAFSVLFSYAILN